MRAEPIASRLYAQTVLHHERRLPAPGQVLVNVGAQVRGRDVIAYSEQPGAVRVVGVADALGIARGCLSRYLRVNVGQEVRAGEVLAATGFMGWRTVVAPVAGRVAGMAAGRVFIEEELRRVELQANLPGQVIRMVPGQGVVIRAAVSRVVGFWGTGDEAFGLLLMRTATPVETVRWTGIDLGCSGKIVVGGQCLDTRVLLRAARFRVLGLVVGGLAEHLRDTAEELGLIVVVTDALGAAAMADPIFEMLAGYEGREGLVTGGRGERWAGQPALSVPLGSVRGPVNIAPERPLAVGDRVRVTRAPHLGCIGYVQAIVEKDGETWVWARLSEDRLVPVAYRNLERLV